MSDRVRIFDTTLRDGEQSCGCSMTVSEKLRMARKLVELGVDVMEAGLPHRLGGRLRGGRSHRAASSGEVSVAALARCSTGDIEKAARALEKAKRPRIHTFIATSPIHLKHKLKKTEDEALESAVKAVELARKYVDDVEFSAEDATRTAPEALEKFALAGGRRRAPAWSTCPTPSATPSPTSTARSSAGWPRRWATRPSSASTVHDDLGLAVANSLAGVQNGARRSSAPSTASASAPATARWKRW
jgi:2-isopropylmalate synthase